MIVFQCLSAIYVGHMVLRAYFKAVCGYMSNANIDGKLRFLILLSFWGLI